MKKDHNVLFQHILAAAEDIQVYVRGVRKSQFLQDKKTQDAVCRQLEIIGEAVKYLPLDQTRRAPTIPWRQIGSMRDMLIHEYFGVDQEIVWQTVKKDLPKLVRAVRWLMKKR